MIRGYFDRDLPYIAGRVSRLDRPGLTVETSLLIDAGATLSVFGPALAASLGLDIETDLAGASRDIVSGFGGKQEVVRYRLRLELDDADAGVTVFRPVIRFLVGSSSAELPSMLGMDFLGAFELRIVRRLDRIELAATY